MGNRIIKESICVSDSIDCLTWFEEVTFYRLIVNCDDYGRTDARLPVLKARLFPLKSVTEKQLDDAINKLSIVGMVYKYECDQRPYLQLATWDKYQQVRTQKSKYPAPDSNCNQLKSDVINCSSRAQNPIQSESNPNTNTNTNPMREVEKETPAIKHRYGEYHHVFLGDEELKKLNNEFTEPKINDYIKRLDEYIENHGVRYKNHNLTIRKWIATDGEKTGIKADSAYKTDDEFLTILQTKVPKL